MAKPSTRNQPTTGNQLAIFEADEPKDEFPKPVEVVHAKPKVQLTLIQGKVANSFLKNAHETEPDAQKYFHISVAKLNADIGYDSHNREHLRKTTEALASIVVTYDVLRPDHKKVKEYSVTSLFPNIRFDDTTVRYKINEELIERVLAPEQYALIDMTVLRRFKRASTGPIYEHCARYINLGTTPPVSVDSLRDIVLGIDSVKGSYSEYKYFKKDVLNPSIDEINAFSDITVVQLMEARTNRRITSLQFVIKRKTKDPVEQSDEAALDQAIVRMESLSIRRIDIQKIVKAHKATEIIAAHQYTVARMEDKQQLPLKKPAAYFAQALANGWALPADDGAGRPLSEGPVVEPGAMSPAAVRDAQAELREEFILEQCKAAKQHFDSLNRHEQLELMAQYNQNQKTIPLLKVTEELKPSAPGTRQFFRALAKERWGSPTDAQLLEFMLARAPLRSK